MQATEGLAVSSEKALEEKGIIFALTCFENGEDALKHLSRQEREQPDLILLDLNLPMTEGVADPVNAETIEDPGRHPQLIRIPFRYPSDQVARRRPLH